MSRLLAGAALLLVVSGSAAGAPSPALIPAVDGTTLAGDHVHLPADLAHIGEQPTVLILGFSRDASTAARAWGKRLADDPRTSTPEPYFVMPVLTGVPRFLRGTVLRAISREVSERGKHHFLPITTDEARWRALAGYHEPGAAYLLVVSPAGQVVWHTSAPLSDQAYNELLQHLQPGRPT